MAIIFRETKGSPLTIQELDTNFRELDERIQALEKSMTPSEGIKEISLEGDELLIKGTYGTLLGNCRFPVIMFHPQGHWKSETLYSAYDVVNADKKILCCLKNHTSENLERDHLYWQVLFEPPEEKSLKSLLQEPKKEQEFSLPLYDPQNLPEASIGQMGLLLGGTVPELIVRGPQDWIKVHDQKIIEKKELHHD